MGGVSDRARRDSEARRLSDFFERSFNP